MSILMWLIVGLIAGVAASLLVGGGHGLLGDILIGIAGAFIGGWGFRELGLHAPLPGVPGTIIVAALGAVVLLLALRFLKSARNRSLI